MDIQETGDVGVDWIHLAQEKRDKYHAGNLLTSRETVRCSKRTARQSVCLLLTCTALRYCAAYGDNSLPKFRDNLSVPSSGFKNLPPLAA